VRLGISAPLARLVERLNDSITVQPLELRSIFVIVTTAAAEARIISGFSKTRKIERGMRKKGKIRDPEGGE